MIKKLTNSITKRLANAYVEMFGRTVGNFDIGSKLIDNPYESGLGGLFYIKNRKIKLMDLICCNS